MSKNALDTNKSALDTNIQKFKILDKYLQNPTQLYTGLSIKRFIKEQIFSQFNGFNNQSIKASRWSAYAHTHLTSSFSNLLQKHKLEPGSRVLVTPLLDPNLIDRLIQNQLRIESLDVQKDTLNFSTTQFKLFLQASKSQNLNFDLIILDCINGLGEEILEQIKIAKSMNIPTMLILPNIFINQNLFVLLEQLELGSVLYYYGENFFTKHLEGVLEGVKLDKQKLFLSWFIETRTSSILEYHLKDSYMGYQDVLSVYGQLLRKQAKVTDWQGILQGFLDPFMDSDNIKIGKLLKPKQSPKPKDLKAQLAREYSKTFGLALPDVAFDIQLSGGDTSSTKHFLSDKTNHLQDQARAWQEYFTSQVASRPSGSIEVPAFYKKRQYIRYFVYSTEFSYWQSQLSSNNHAMKTGFPIHTIFKNNQKLPNAKFISSFMILIKLDQPNGN